jgi:hypothetical protein
MLLLDSGPTVSMALIPLMSHPVLTMYVPGSEIHVHNDYINDSS